MATATEPHSAEAARASHPTVGPEHHGLPMAYEEFIEADFQEGWLYELARGIVIVTQVPGIRHGMIVFRLAKLFILYDAAHPGAIKYQAGGSECRLRLPGMKSDRHPDQAIYLQPYPKGRTSGLAGCPRSSSRSSAPVARTGITSEARGVSRGGSPGILDSRSHATAADGLARTSASPGNRPCSARTASTGPSCSRASRRGSATCSAPLPPRTNETASH